jgi:hypothetical protein
MWYLETVILGDIETITQRIKIEDLLDRAEKSLIENSHKITQLRAQYLVRTGTKTDEERKEYSEFLESSIQDPVKKPYALILKFYYYDALRDANKGAAIISELEAYTHLDEVARVLFGISANVSIQRIIEPDSLILSTCIPSSKRMTLCYFIITLSWQRLITEISSLLMSNMSPHCVVKGMRAQY